jgi:hypothetical protein
MTARREKSLSRWDEEGGDGERCREGTADAGREKGEREQRNDTHSTTFPAPPPTFLLSAWASSASLK